jgi:hypothetical protein
MVWAGGAGDRSLWWGGYRRGGERKVADRIAKEMKKALFSRYGSGSISGFTDANPN